MPRITYLTPSLAIPALTLLPVISPLTEPVFIEIANKPDILFHAKHNYVIAYLLNSPTIGYIIPVSCSIFIYVFSAHLRTAHAFYL